MKLFFYNFSIPAQENFKLGLSLHKIILILILLSPPAALCQKIKVQKIKNGKAVIETNADLVEGRSYYLSDGPMSQDVNYASEGLRSRKNSVSFDFSFNNVSSDSSKNSELTAKARYGWNFLTMEFGPLLKFQSKQSGSVSSSDYLIGGFFDYNLVPNKDGVHLVYGINAQIGYGNSTPTSGASYSILAMSGAGFVKWFVFTSQLAVRADLGLEMDQVARSSGNTTNSGVFTSVGLTAYY